MRGAADNLPWWRRPLFQFKVLAVWAFLIWERMGIARDLGAVPDDRNFTVTGSQSLGVDITPAELVEICVAENDRRLAGYDPPLLRPVVVPRLARLARRFMGKPRPAVVPMA